MVNESLRGKTLTIAVLYPWDWSKEFQDYAEGRVPSHRLFGAAELSGFGHNVRICCWGSTPHWLRGRITWKVYQALWLLLTQQSLDCIYGTTEAASLPSLLTRRILLLRRPLVVSTIAVLTPKYLEGWAGSLRRWLLRAADGVITYASFQVPLLVERVGLRGSVVHFVPFGVDCKFFAPRLAQLMEWDILSVGTNTGKDFSTLVQALPLDRRACVVTDPGTRATLDTQVGGHNLTLMSNIPIDELRTMYSRAKVIVVPLHDTEFSSGQTVLLESLAMARPVIVTNTRAVQDYIDDGVVVTVVPVGDANALASRLNEEWPSSNPSAREWVEEHFSVTTMAGSIEEALRRVSVRRSRRRRRAPAR